MAIDRTPVLKRCRSLGLAPAFMGISKESKRQVRRQNRKKSEYGIQLTEKQKAKFIYGVLEKQFRGYFEIAEKQKGITGHNLLIHLESRLDNVVYRLGMATSRKEARQLVDHEHFLINGKKLNIPSYIMKEGDVIEVRPKSKKSQKFKDILEVTENRTVAPWLSKDVETLSGKVIGRPAVEDLDVEIAEHLIVELYSK